MHSEPQVARALVGGRWAVSLRGYLLLAPVAVLWIPLVVPDLFSAPGGWLAGIAVGIGTYLPTGLVLWLASVSLLRKRRTEPVSVLTVVLVGAVAWMARSASLAFIIDVSNAPVPAAWTSRLATGFVIGSILVPATAWALASLDRFRSERDRLVAELTALQVLQRKYDAQLETVRQRVVLHTQELVEEALANAGRQVGAANSADPIAMLAKGVGQDIPRILWATEIPPSRVTAALVMRTASLHPFRVWPMLFAIIVGVLNIGRYGPWPVAIAAMLAAAAWCWTVVVAFNWRGRASHRASIARYLTGIALLACSGLAILAVLLIAGLPVTISASLSVMLGTGLAVVIGGVGIASAISTAEQRVLDSLRESIDEVEVEARACLLEEERLNKTIATRLHTSVGARLHATALRRSQSKETPLDLQSWLEAEALAETRWLVERELHELSRDEESTLHALMDDIASPWEGLASVTWRIDGPESIDPAPTRTVDDIVTEAIANSVRHGGAHHVDVHLVVGEHSVAITVSDDGNRRELHERGLGSRVLDTLAPGNWQIIDRAPQGTVLQVYLPR